MRSGVSRGDRGEYTRIGNLFLSTVLVLMSSVSSDAQASDSMLGSSKEPPLRGGVSVDEKAPADSEPPTDLELLNADGTVISETKPDKSPIIMGSDLFSSDGTKCVGMSWITHGDGNIMIQRMDKGPQFEAHNQRAWEFMQIGSNMERHSAIARNNGDADGQRRWHQRALVQFGKAKSELEEHLRLIQSGDVSVPVFYTLSNLATCTAFLGDTRQSLQYYNQFLQARERFWTIPYGSFRLATVLMNDAKSNEELDAAKQLLLRTVGAEPPFCWNQHNNDPEYRVITWRLISEIQQRQGDLNTSEESKRQAQKLLQPIAQKISQNSRGTCRDFVEKTLQEIHTYGIP